MQRARAFDRFWQAPGTHSGSGLGLAITRQLATASGGTVELATGPGGGIDARARFRAAPPLPARHHPARLEPPPRTG